MQKLIINKSGYPYDGFRFSIYRKKSMEPDFNPEGGVIVNMGKPRKNIGQLFYQSDFFVMVVNPDEWQGDVCDNDEIVIHRVHDYLYIYFSIYRCVHDGI